MNIHFIGIAGAGCLPLAILASERGDMVTGSDLAPEKKASLLESFGIKVYSGHDAHNLPDKLDLVVYSSAVTSENPELAVARHQGIKTLLRGEFLAEIAKEYKRVVAVSGSHGKSSVASLLSFVLNRQRIAAGYAIGAQFANNLAPASRGDGDILVIEADESDGSHTFLHPYLGLVTNIDDDHAWNLGGEDKLFTNFRCLGANSHNLIYFAGAKTSELYRDIPGAHPITLEDFNSMGLPEFSYPAANARLVMAAALFLGGDAQMSCRAIADFPGIARRMTRRYYSEGLTVVEDYAHHPAELNSALDLLRINYPKHYLKVIFQPHRQARLEKYFDEFAQALQKADEVIVAPLFEAWISDGGEHEVDGRLLARRIGNKARYGTDWEGIAQAALNYSQDKPLLIAVIGAGDVNCVLDYLPGGGGE